MLSFCCWEFCVYCFRSASVGIFKSVFVNWRKWLKNYFQLSLKKLVLALCFPVPLMIGFHASWAPAPHPAPECPLSPEFVYSHPRFFSQSSVLRHLGCFQISATVNNTATIIDVQISFWIEFLGPWASCQEAKLLMHIEGQLLVFF